MTVCAALLLIVPAASAVDWSDNFDSYALGSGLHGQGGWAGWDGSVAADAFVADTEALSAPHSVRITPTSDIVQEFTETTGEWEMTAWCYIPTGSTGNQFFIMLNMYTPDGVANDKWSVQLKFDSDAGIVSNTMHGSTASAPLIRNTWVEVKIKIYLDTNMQDTYYNGAFMDSTPWQDGTGANEIAALDLFSDGGSTIYWDDCKLIQTNIALEHTTWGRIKTLLQ